MILFAHSFMVSIWPIGSGCIIHQLHLSREATPPIECPVYDSKLSHGAVPVMMEFWGMWGTISLSSLPGPLCPGVVTPDRVLSMGQIELNSTLMLNWFSWKRTVLIFKLRTYAKLNCLKLNCFWHWNLIKLNWIAWNRTVLTFNCK